MKTFECKSCNTCEHQYMNHKKCDIPFNASCISFSWWKARRELLCVFNCPKCFYWNVENYGCNNKNECINNSLFKCALGKV